jgi:hypothetical protein
MNRVDFWEGSSRINTQECGSPSVAIEAAQVWVHLPGRSAVLHDERGPALTLWHDGTMCCVSRLRDSQCLEGRLK